MAYPNRSCEKRGGPMHARAIRPTDHPTTARVVTPPCLLARSTPRKPRQATAIRTYASSAARGELRCPIPNACAACRNTDGADTPSGTAPVKVPPDELARRKRRAVGPTTKARQVPPKLRFFATAASPFQL